MTRDEAKSIKEWLKENPQVSADLIKSKNDDSFELLLFNENKNGEKEYIIFVFPLTNGALN